MLLPIVLLLLSENGLTASVSEFADWEPDPQNGFTYCEYVLGSDPQGGVACGGNAFAEMKKNVSELSVNMVAGATLGLLNIGSISRVAFSTQKDFYRACKPYFIRLYDGLYQSYDDMRCVTAFPTPAGIDPDCDASSNFIMRSGSGYCMSEPVCGANVKVSFLANVNNPSSVTFLWGQGAEDYTSANISTEVGRCYAYQLKEFSDPLEATIEANL